MARVRPARSRSSTEEDLVKRTPLVLAGLVAGAAIAVPLGSAGAQSPGGRTLTFVERDKGSTFGFVDNPPKSPKHQNRFSAGDSFVFSNPLFDTSGKSIGRLHASCAADKPGSPTTATVVCHGAFRFQDGMVTVEVLSVVDAKDVTGAVTGGTGAYEGARGNVVSHNTKSGANDTITLDG
jgi:Dirigent-like protein